MKKHFNNIIIVPLKLLILMAVLALAIVYTGCLVVFIPLYYLNRPLLLHISTYFTYACWTLLSCNFRLTSKVQGENKLKAENYLFICNHIGSIDFVVLNELARDRNMISYLKYTSKESLKCIPIFYQTILFSGFLIVRRNFETDNSRIQDYFRFMQGLDLPLWFILYPEGTRFTPEKRSLSWEHSEKKGVEKFNNVLFPRVKGFKLICEELKNSKIKNLADVTIYYTEKTVPTLWNFFCLPQSGIFKYDVKITPIDEIADPEQYLFDSFRRKDQLIDNWKCEDHHE